jgi:phosphoglycolate phosphatase
MIKAVLFDFDDTLVDTFNSKIPAIIEYCASVNNVSIDSREVESLWGMPFWEKMRILSKSTEIDTSRYLAISEKYPLLPFPESEKTLTELQSRVSIGIVTSLARPVLLHSLSALGWSAVSFTTLVAEGEASANKPDPRVFEPALASLEGIKREEILYVGDALTDARAASDAGLHFLGIARDNNRQSTFREAGFRHESSLTGVLKLC